MYLQAIKPNIFKAHSAKNFHISRASVGSHGEDGLKEKRERSNDSDVGIEIAFYVG